MLTSAQKYQLDKSVGSDVVDGMEFVQGNTLALSKLASPSNIPTSSNPGGFYYNAADNTIVVNKNGAVLNGLNLSGVCVDVIASNVTIRNCTFNDLGGSITVLQQGGYSGLQVTNCTFNGGDNVQLADFISSIDGYITVENNSFIDTPSHGIGITNGVVENNSFVGGGYMSGAHADAINIYNTTGSVLVSGNYVDWTSDAVAAVGTNNAIRITNQGGANSDVVVTNNVFLGGSYTVAVMDVNNDPLATFSNVVIEDNYIGDYLYGAYYPSAPAGVTLGSYTDVGFDNPGLATAAWSAYQTTGVATNNLVTATAGQTSISAAATGTSTLYGSSVNGLQMYGGASETIFVGGAGLDYMHGGSGKNIFSFLAVADSVPYHFDFIGNFNVATDVIDLHAIGAEPGSATPVNFTFIGDAPFSGAGGQVSVIQDAAADETLVEADFVGDSSADFEVAITGLVNLTAANFALTNAQYQADIAPFTTVASFLTSRSTLDKVAGGYSIIDSAANIGANIAGLEADAAHIDAVTLTSGAISVNVATFVSDKTILQKIVGGFTVVDSAASIQTKLSALEADAAEIGAVTLTSGALSVNAATFNADRPVLGKVAGGYAIADSATNIVARLASLEACAANINSVTVTSPAAVADVLTVSASASSAGALSVNVATFLSDETILNKLVGGFAIADTGANVEAQMSALEKEAGPITTVTLSGSKASAPDVLTLTQSNVKSDAAILAEIVSPYVLEATNGAVTTVSGIGAGLTLDIGPGNATVTGGAAGDTFHFSANFGTGQITDFSAYAATATPDAISLSTADFANWSTLLSDAHSTGGNANTTFVAADGASLTVDGLSLTSLQHASTALKAEFQFHA